MTLRCRRGHIFSLDVVIAVLILIIGISVLFYNFPIKNRTYYMTDRLSADITIALAETRTSDLCSGIGSPSCSCSIYSSLEDIVCSDDIVVRDATLLSLFTEGIQRKSISGDDVKAVIKEIFVEKNVIDTVRFGFAIIYTSPDFSEPKELFNTEADL